MTFALLVGWLILMISARHITVKRWHDDRMSTGAVDITGLIWALLPETFAVSGALAGAAPAVLLLIALSSGLGAGLGALLILRGVGRNHRRP